MGQSHLSLRGSTMTTRLLVSFIVVSLVILSSCSAEEKQKDGAVVSAGETNGDVLVRDTRTAGRGEGGGEKKGKKNRSKKNKVQSKGKTRAKKGKGGVSEKNDKGNRRVNKGKKSSSKKNRG